MHTNRNNGVGCSSGNGDGAATAEFETLPPYTPTAPQMDVARVRLGRETLQNPCFWILVGAVGAVAVGAVIVWSMNNRD